MKWLKALAIVLVVLIVGSATGLIFLAKTNSKNEGNIEGTGFIKKEVFGLRGDRFDVDDYGNFYFAVNGPLIQYVSIYDNKGKYKCSLKVFTSGSIRVRIDDENNILVGFLREREIAHYTSDGVLKNIEEDVSPFFWDEFHYTEKIRERNDTIYKYRSGRIIKEANGIQSIVFNVPTWQRWYGAFELILIFSCIAMFFRIGVPQWIKAYKDMIVDIERKKKEKEEYKIKANKEE